MPALDNILSDVLALNTTDKLHLVDKILTSLQPVNKGVEASWEEEAEERVTAHKQGHISDIDAQEVFAKYDK